MAKLQRCDECGKLLKLSENTDALLEVSCKKCTAKLEGNLVPNTTPEDNTKLTADHAFTIGDFQILLNEDTKELRISVLKSSLRLVIKPKSDNSCSIAASR